jgi:siroheme synthase-like protein
MLKLHDEISVVVGAGAVALRKTRALGLAGATVRLVTGTNPEQAIQAELPGKIELLVEDYQPGHLVGAKLVFACTNNRDVNARIAADARAAGVLVNVADQPGDCDFFMPATICHGDVVIAIGTGGQAPALSSAIKEQLQAGDALPEQLGLFAALLGDIRQKLLTRIDLPPEARAGILKNLAKRDMLDEFIAAGPEALIERASELAQSGEDG